MAKRHIQALPAQIHMGQSLLIKELIQYSATLLSIKIIPIYRCRKYSTEGLWSLSKDTELDCAQALRHSAVLSAQCQGRYEGPPCTAHLAHERAVSLITRTPGSPFLVFRSGLQQKHENGGPGPERQFPELQRPDPGGRSRKNNQARDAQQTTPEPKIYLYRAFSPATSHRCHPSQRNCANTCRPS